MSEKSLAIEAKGDTGPSGGRRASVARGVLDALGGEAASVTTLTVTIFGADAPAARSQIRRALARLAAEGRIQAAGKVGRHRVYAISDPEFETTLSRALSHDLREAAHA